MMLRRFGRTVDRQSRLLAFFLACAASLAASGAGNLLQNGGFENGFTDWTCWGRNADLITLDGSVAHSGTNSARIQHGKNALYFSRALVSTQAYELRFAYRLAGDQPSGQAALGFFKPGGTLNSGGAQKFTVLPLQNPAGWSEFREVFLPTAVTRSCQFSFTAAEGSTLWLDDVSLKAVARPPELKAIPAPFEGLARTTSNPLFKELLSNEPGQYTVVCWSHDLNPRGKQGLKAPQMADDTTWQKEVRIIFKEAGEAGMGFLDLPGRLDGSESWRTPEFHREQFAKYGVRFDVWSEGSESIAAGIKRGAELLNGSAKALGARASVSWVDPAYVEAQTGILQKLGARLRDYPFVGYYYGKDEPLIHIPEGPPSSWAKYGQAMAKEVREKYGFGRFDPPQPKDDLFLKDPNRPFRWIAYNRWANDRFIDTRTALARTLHQAHPEARYSPANYCFMGAVPSFDYSRLSACSDLMEADPYATSGERTRGRGVFNHGFGAKFLADLTDKPVRIVAQAFDYAGYDMSSENLREWVSQSLRCGASAIDYYEMDSPRWTHRDRWQMMLHLSSLMTRMSRIAIPKSADTAILYTLYTHMSEGPTGSGDQVYAAHALLGEFAGSWFKFISDVQLERGERQLKDYKAVHLPVGKYMTPEATKVIEEYVRGGGALICGDAEAFSFAIDGTDTRERREQILGMKLQSGKEKAVRGAEEIILKSDVWGLSKSTRLRLFPSRYGEQAPEIRAFAVTISDTKAKILAEYEDGSPAIIERSLGKGKVIVFAANPFGPEVTVDPSAWPAALKGLQQSLGCKVDQPIWRFVLPAPAKTGTR